MDRGTTWSSIGKSVEECRDVNQVLQASGLDYRVDKRPVFADVDGKDVLIPDRFVTTNTNGKIYDIVSDKFEVVQNSDAFDFVSYMGDEFSFERAGETGSGMVYIIGKLPEVDILGDTFTPHVIFRNGFSGKVKISAAICPLRIVCQNQFNFAFQDTQNSVAIRHVQNAGVKLQEAREVLRVSADFMAELNTQAHRYAGMKLNKADVAWIINSLFPIPEDTSTINSFALHRLTDAKEDFVRAYDNDDNGNFRGTAWGIINAYADYITHKAPMGNTSTRQENKFMTTVFHPALMNKILTLVSARAAA